MHRPGQEGVGTGWDEPWLRGLGRMRRNRNSRVLAAIRPSGHAPRLPEDGRTERISSENIKVSDKVSKQMPPKVHRSTDRLVRQTAYPSSRQQMVAGGVVGWCVSRDGSVSDRVGMKCVCSFFALLLLCVRPPVRNRVY